MTKSAFSKAKKIATGFLGSEMTPPLSDIFRKFIGFCTYRLPLFYSFTANIISHRCKDFFLCYHYLGRVYASQIQYNTLKFCSNVFVYVSVIVFAFPHVFVLRRNMQSDLCRDYHGLSMCIRGGRPLWHPANVTSRCILTMMMMMMMIMMVLLLLSIVIVIVHVHQRGVGPCGTLQM